MQTKTIKLTLLLLVIALIGYMIYESSAQPGVKDLKGNFKEVAFYRNENNTGPIIRIYAVTVKDTLWEEMKQYGDFMPHTKYGTTKVYFFLANKPSPSKLTPGVINFDNEFNEYLIAEYHKDAMSQTDFKILVR